MQDDPISQNTPLSPEEENAKAAMLTECDKLAQAGVAFVAVHFDGCGDSGVTEEVRCYDGEQYAWGDIDPVKSMRRICKITLKLSSRGATKTTAAALEMSFSMWRHAK